ncbi:asparaginyl/glutamyl-tRNA amidotransferase subunit C [bacterium J17]|nr:asparaginyl/glutamyl-tRNA amidotransferase subunit C [bacterium J17]
MAISEEEILYIARLAAISLSEDELELYKGDLNKILDYVDCLKQVSTENVEPTSHVHGSVNALREDIVKASLSLEDVRANAPDFSEQGFMVPKII